MEIERKWIFDNEKAPENIEVMGEYFYNQAYLSIDPEVRIRKRLKAGEKNETYALCIKSKGSLERIEVQKELTEKEFSELMIVGKLKEEDFIRKHFYRYKIGQYELTLGRVDSGRKTEFCYGEIEFSSKDEAESFKAPDWFGREVTDDKNFKMCSYWQRTREIKNK
ncbi:MAG: CYTH domain-containing protein [Clostridium sp.]|nr:CYTH domain-containing protein [Clostridium sp.]